jgi:hypothetical protein
MKSFPSEKKSDFAGVLLLQSKQRLSGLFAASLTCIDGQDELFLNYFALEAQIIINNALLRIH